MEAKNKLILVPHPSKKPLEIQAVCPKMYIVHELCDGTVGAWNNDRSMILGIPGVEGWAALRNSNLGTSNIKIKCDILCSPAEKIATKINAGISPLATKQWSIKVTMPASHFTVNLPSIQLDP